MVECLLSPTITTAVDKAVTAGLEQLMKELKEQSQQISEAAHWISTLVDELLQACTTIQQYSIAQQTY